VKVTRREAIAATAGAALSLAVPTLAGAAQDTIHLRYSPSSLPPKSKTMTELVDTIDYYFSQKDENYPKSLSKEEGKKILDLWIKETNEDIDRSIAPSFEKEFMRRKVKDFLIFHFPEIV
jgi:hypothetical protein